MTDERLAEIRRHWATAKGWYPASMSGYSYDTAVVVIDNAYAAITDLLQALADAETRAARDAERLAAADALQAAVSQAILVLGAADQAYDAARLAATPRPDAGLCAVCGGTRITRSRYTLPGGRVIEQDEPCGDCVSRPDAGQGVG